MGRVKQKKLNQDMFKKFLELFSYEKRMSKKIADFAHYNKDLLIIVADPKTDKLFISHKDKFFYNQIKSATGKRTKVVKGILSHSLFKKEVDNFLVSIMDTLQLSLKDGNQFYQWIDGSLYKLARTLRLGRVEKGDKPVFKSEPLNNNQASDSAEIGAHVGANTPIA